MRRIMQDLSYLYIMHINTMQKCQNERLLCHNVFLWVHYACIVKPVWYIHMLGYIYISLFKIAIWFFPFFQKTTVYKKIRMATLFQLRIQWDSFDQFE